jgi:RNA polymerase sigma-70 factor (ECF subfamily)
MEHSTFEELIAPYRGAMGAAAYHLCGDRDAAQDIVQETMLDAYRGFARLRDASKAGAWLFAILRRKALAHRKSRRQEAPLTEDIPAAGADAAAALVIGIVREQMERLTPEDRDVLAGKYLLGLSYAEIAEALGVKEGAVAVRCFRAKERLREALRGCGVGPPEGERHDL